MWDLRVARPFGRLSVRNLFLFAAATIAACLTFILTSSPITHADNGTATWSGSSISYLDNEYQQNGTAGTNDSRGFDQGTQLYTFIEPAANGGAEKMHIIYFAAGVDTSKATSAGYVVYDYTPPDGYANPTDKTTITLTPQSAAKQATSCDSSFTFGLGWIICPATNFLANAMDWIFGIVSSFLTVRPVSTDQNNALFSIWSVMRNFANVVFVIGFMVVIYSQLTSIGLSNYNVKKMLPRLIIAAILVNISYWICAVAVDASNILGYSIERLFMSIHDSVIGTGGNQWSVISFKSIAGFILSGGTAALAGGLALHAGLAATVGGSITLLLPILAGLLLAIFIALVVLAARQAIIVVLIIVSPLAFVAFLLPNTEKYFKKWHELFTTMLVMFPIFAFVFGGSQLAGIAIIQTADSINLIILGMAVQIAPLAITPLLLRLSGSLLGRIAGLANNPSKGLVDRTRKFAEERAAQRKARVLANPGMRRRDFLNRTSARIDAKRRAREGWQKANEAMTEAKWANDHRAHEIHERALEAALLKQGGETAAEARFEAQKHANARIQGLELNARASKLNLDLAKARVDANWDEFRAGDSRNMVVPEGLSVSALANFAHSRNATAQEVMGHALETSVETQRGTAARNIQTQQIATALNTNQDLSRRAGGIDPSGAVKAQAHAVSELSKESDAALDAGIKLINYRALQNNKTAKDFSGDVVAKVMAGSTDYNSSEIEAALELQAREGQVVALENARMNAAHIDQDMLSRVIARNAPTMKVKGGFHLQANPNLAGVSLTDMNIARAGSLGDTAASNMKDLKAGWVKEIAKEINNITAVGSTTDLNKAYNNVFEALTNDQIRATIGDRIGEIQTIEYALRKSGRVQVRNTTPEQDQFLKQ